jgi:hypothetical protein
MLCCGCMGNNSAVYMLFEHYYVMRVQQLLHKCHSGVLASPFVVCSVSMACIIVIAFICISPMLNEHTYPVGDRVYSLHQDGFGNGTEDPVLMPKDCLVKGVTTMEYVYHCKKNGRDYTYTTELDNLAPQDAYAWRRGVREYADNYHASITKEGIKKAGKTIPWDDEDEFKETVSKYCDEALDKFMSGDVPGERVATDPVAMTERLAKRYNIDPQTLAKFLEEQAKLGRAA